LITRHTQDCEQLQKRTDQEQARFQSASERQNQMIAACSSLLKNKHDIISMINRHLV
jgi:hypothetical protein